MTGCRHNAKTPGEELPRFGRECRGRVQPMTTVTGFEQFGEGYAIDVKRTDAPRKTAGGSTPNRSSWPAGAYKHPARFCTR